MIRPPVLFAVLIVLCADAPVSLAHTIVDSSADTGTDQSAINVAGNANLNGALEIQFENYTPNVGDTWNFFDAGEIAGSFSQIDWPTDQLAPGAGLFLTVVTGGDNGNLYQLSVGAQLVLSVDRRTGHARLENRTLTESMADVRASATDLCLRQLGAGFHCR